MNCRNVQKPRYLELCTTRTGLPNTGFRKTVVISPPMRRGSVSRHLVIGAVCKKDWPGQLLEQAEGLASRQPASDWQAWALANITNAPSKRLEQFPKALSAVHWAVFTGRSSLDLPEGWLVCMINGLEPLCLPS